MHARWLGPAAAVLVFALAGCVAADLPNVTESVTDLAGLLDDATEQALTSELRAVERETGVEIAVVVTAASRWGLQQSVARLFSAWSTRGRRSESGVLIVSAPQKYAGRIHVGRALEAILPDGLVSQVWDSSFQPYFQSGQYQTGVTEGVARVVHIVRAGHVVTPEERLALDAEANPRMSRWATWPSIGLMMALGAGLLGAGIRGGDRRAMAVGGTWAGLLLLASLAPIVNVPLGLAVPLVTVMLGLGYWKSERGRPVLGIRQRPRRPRRGRSS